MKEIVSLILASLAARLQKADQIEDPQIRAFARNLALQESRKALNIVL